MTSETRTGQRARAEILDAALSRFAIDGFAATSVQTVADACGCSKSAVLYHFDSKDQMLDAALTPALVALEGLLKRFEDAQQREQPDTLVASFVDFLLGFRREAAILLIQGPSLADLGVMRRSQALLSQLARSITQLSADPEQRMGIGIGLAGAAYVLAMGESYLDDAPISDEDHRTALIAVLTDLFRMDH